MAFPRVASLKTAQAFRARLDALGLSLPFDEQVLPAPASPLAQPLSVGGWHAGNRWAILPMEGWDGTPDGRPSELTTRRWQHFGRSGAKVIWGGEAVAVREDGRANPNQLVIREDTLPADFVVDARCAEDPALVMGIRHRFRPSYGVQFHPESFLTVGGRALMTAFLETQA